MVPLGGFTHPGECPPAQEGPSLSPCNSQAMVGFQPPGERQSLHMGVTAGPGVPAGAVARAPSSLLGNGSFLDTLPLPAGMSCADRLLQVFVSHWPVPPTTASSGFIPGDIPHLQGSAPVTWPRCQWLPVLGQQCGTLTPLLVLLQVGEVEPGADGVQQQPVLQGQPVPIQVSTDRRSSCWMYYWMLLWRHFGELFGAAAARGHLGLPEIPHCSADPHQATSAAVSVPQVPPPSPASQEKFWRDRSGGWGIWGLRTTRCETNHHYPQIPALSCRSESLDLGPRICRMRQPSVSPALRCTVLAPSSLAWADLDAHIVSISAEGR